ncbi:MAG: RNA pseudouridine synthase [Opitutales bacterium]|nr:RNA pseudouridine synthase [Opitutales bacterium]
MAFDLPYDLPLGKGASIIAYHPSGLVALDKPEGVLSVPNQPSDLKKSLINSKFSKKEEAYVWYSKEKERCYFYICHRLDSPTSGVIIGALSEKVATEVKKHFKGREIEKEYLAAVIGSPRGKNGVWKDALKKTKGGSQVRNTVVRGGQESSCTWKIIGRNSKLDLTLLSLKPHTGRTHQLRVQTSSRNLPILGDKTYGNFKRNAFYRKDTGINRMLLHSKQIRLKGLKIGDHRIDFQAHSKTPPQFAQLFDNV